MIKLRLIAVAAAVPQAAELIGSAPSWRKVTRGLFLAGAVGVHSFAILCEVYTFRLVSTSSPPHWFANTLFRNNVNVNGCFRSCVSPDFSLSLVFETLSHFIRFHNYCAVFIAAHHCGTHTINDRPITCDSRTLRINQFVDCIF